MRPVIRDVARLGRAGAAAGLATLLLTSSACRSQPPPPEPSASAPPVVDFDALAARVDPYAPKQRVLILTDIANEPDDQMSMVRFLVYANHFDVEGLVAGTSTWMRNKVRPDVLTRW